MDVHLFITSKNEGRQQQITLADPKQIVLGRGPSSAALLDGPGISREHVAVTVDESKIFVTDISVNGTWINGMRLPQQQKRRLEPGDVLEIPGYELAIQIDKAADQETTSREIESQETARIPSPSPEPVRIVSRRFTVLDYLIIGLALVSILLAVYFVVSSF